MSHYYIDRSRSAPIQPSRHGLAIGARAAYGLVPARHAGAAGPLAPPAPPAASGMSTMDLAFSGVVLAIALLAAGSFVGAR